MAVAVWNQVRAQFPDFDRRSVSFTNNPAVIAGQMQAESVLKTRLRDAVVGNRSKDGQVFITRRGGFLSGPDGEGGAVPPARVKKFSAGEPHRPVKAFLDEYSSLVGHDSSALDTAQVKREFVGKHNGMRTIIWQQQRSGVPVFEAVLVAHVSRRGELINLCDRFHGQSSSTGDKQAVASAVTPKLSAVDAIIAAASGVGVPLTAKDVQPLASASGAARSQKFIAAGLLGETTAALTWLPMDSSEMRLCWDLILTEPVNGEMFRVLVDANTGEELLRRSLTVYLSDATYRVYTSDSPSPFSPGHSEPMTNQPPLVERTLVTWSALDTNASPAGWISDGENTTLGNNVDAHLDKDHNNIPDPGSRPEGSPFRVFDFDMDLTKDSVTYTNASVVQLFYWCNWMHDRLYELGFTEAAGNFQTDNFGRGGIGDDALQADAQDGLDVNNANMSTPSDGTSPRMQMFIWTGTAEGRDGSLDAEIVLHEYTHGLSQRLVGGGVGIHALQTKGMGEGWSDFYALSLLSETNDDPNACYAVGGYASYMIKSLTQNYYFGGRRYPYTTDMGKNPLTFKDIDPKQADLHDGVPASPIVTNAMSWAPEPHHSGEVWCAALWEIRANLIDKYGFSGNQLALQLVTDGMNLAPANPNFLEARDAIIQADLINNGGANSSEIWAAFAKRGMGYSAVSPDSSTTTGLIEAYDQPSALDVSPFTISSFRGETGGTFSPAEATYMITNHSETALDWSVSKTQPWMTVSGKSGTLSGGGTLDVEVSINAEADNLSAGVYSDTLVFSNSLDSEVQIRTVQLEIIQVTNLVIHGSARLTAHSVHMYDCYAQYTDGSVSNVTDSAAWDLVSDTYGVTLNGHALSAGDVSSDGSVTVRAVYNNLADTYPVLVETVPSGLSALSTLFDDPTADAEDVVYSGGYAYVACGYAGVSIFDVSDPVNPAKVGVYDTEGFAKALAVQSNKVFIADDRIGLLILDVTDPANPLPVGKYMTKGNCYDIAVSGDYAYLAAYNDGLVILNISNPSSLQLVKSYTAGTTRAWGVAVEGNYAYVADYTNGLKIIDISTPANPVLSGSYPVEGQSHGVAIQDGYAYVAAYTNGLQIIDVSNPASPVYAGEYVTNYCYGVAVEGSFAYLANYVYGLQIIDVSDPSGLVRIGGFGDNSGAANAVSVSGGKAYIANDYGGLQVLDVSVPEEISLLGSCDTHRYAYDIAVKGSYAYLAGYRDGLITVDISNPVFPVILASNKWANYVYAGRIDVSGSILCVAGHSAGLVIYDLSDPSLPKFVTKYSSDSVGTVWDVKVSGNYAYCANYVGSANALSIVDVSDPVHPVYVGGYNSGVSAYGIDVQGQYAYLGSHTNGLQIFDISDPANPVLKGAYKRAVGPQAGRVSVSGNYAYVLDVSDVLQIIDIQNPNNPTLWKTLDIGTISQIDSDIFVQNPYVYVAYGHSSFPTNSGLWIIDVTDTANPVMVTNYLTSGYGRGVTACGGYVYLADDPKLLHILAFGGKESDSDSDEIPDWWEGRYFGGATNASSRSVCANGVNSVLQAYIAGFSPVDPSAVFNLFREHGVFKWDAVSGRVYSVYWTTNLLDVAGFQCIQSNVPWTQNSITNMPVEPCGYYKIDVRLAE